MIQHLLKSKSGLKGIILVLLFLLVGELKAQNYKYWRGVASGNNSTDWNNDDNWSPKGAPDSSHDVIIGDAGFTSGKQPELEGKGFYKYCNSLEIRASATLKVYVGNGQGNGLALNVSESLTIKAGGKLISEAATLEVGGDWINDGEFIEDIGTSGRTALLPSVYLDGTNKVIGGLAVTKFSLIRIVGNISLDQDIIIKPFYAGTLDRPWGLIVTGTGTLDPKLKKVSWQRVSSNSFDFTVRSGGTIFVRTSTFQGNYENALTTPIVMFPTLLEATGTINYGGELNQEVLPSKEYGILRISGSGTKTLQTPVGGVATIVRSSLFVDSGILDLATHTLDRPTTSTTGGILEAATGTTIKVGNTTDLSSPRSNFPRGFSTVSLHQNSTVEYYGADQIVRNINYGNLSFTGSGTKTLAAGTTGVSNVFSINSGVAANTLINKSTVNYNGTVAQTVVLLPETQGYHHLTLSNTGTKNIQAGTTYIAGNLTVSSPYTGIIENATTFNFNGTEAQSVAPINYYNLTLTNDGIKTFTNTTGVQADFISTTTPSRANLTATETTINFNGTGAQMIPALWYSKVLVSQGGDKTLAANIYIKRELELASGRVNTGEAKITLGPAATIVESENNYVTGTVETKRVLAASSNNFGGIGITITPKVEADSTKVTRVTGTKAATINNSILRHFTVEPTANQGSYDADMVFRYFDHELNGLTEAELLGFYSELFWKDTEWMTYWKTAQAPALNQVTLSNIRSLGRYTLGNGSPNPMPVELTSFTAIRKGTDAELNWTVAREENNKGFEIQASTDGFSFQKISFVNSKVETSNSKQVYSFTDNRNNKQGTIYYRLKQVDHDGKSTVYAPRDVKFSTVAGTTVSAYPNPFSEKFTTELFASKPVTAVVKLYSATGRLLLVREDQLLTGKNLLEFITDAHTSKGMYILSVDLGNEVHKFKLIKQ